MKTFDEIKASILGQKRESEIEETSAPQVSIDYEKMSGTDIFNLSIIDDYNRNNEQLQQANENIDIYTKLLDKCGNAKFITGAAGIISTGAFLLAAFLAAAHGDAVVFNDVVENPAFNAAAFGTMIPTLLSWGGYAYADAKEQLYSRLLEKASTKKAECEENKEYYGTELKHIGPVRLYTKTEESLATDVQEGDSVQETPSYDIEQQDTKGIQSEGATESEAESTEESVETNATTVESYDESLEAFKRTIELIKNDGVGQQDDGQGQ